MSTARASLPGGAPLSRRAALAVVIAAHAVVLIMWQAPHLRNAGPTSSRTTISVVLLPAVIAAPPDVAPPLPSRQAPATRQARRHLPSAIHTPSLPTATPAADPTAPPSSTVHPANEAPAVVTPPVTTDEAPLLDSAATRRAIADAARRPSLAAQAGIDNRESALQTPDARLGTEIAKGARGDCVKGEYAGAGMGVLSLPFLAAAVLSDKCRR